MSKANKPSCNCSENKRMKFVIYVFLFRIELKWAPSQVLMRRSEKINYILHLSKPVNSLLLFIGYLMKVVFVFERYLYSL